MLKYILKKRGGQGDAPLGLLPPLGRGGVILQAAAENERIETKEHFYRANNSLKKRSAATFFFRIFPFTDKKSYRDLVITTTRVGSDHCRLTVD